MEKIKEGMPMRLRMLTCLLFGLMPGLAHAEANVLRIGMQYGASMLPFMIMQRERMVETRAVAAGLGAVAVSYQNLSGPASITDAVLSGSLDVGANGAPALLVLWDKTRNSANPIRGMAAVSNNPSILVTRNPNVRSIADFTEQDRIAMPGVKTAINAILLQMAAAKLWGPSAWDRLDPRTVSLGNPDALVAMLTGSGGITAHFSQPTFALLEIKAGMRPILRTKEILGDGWDMIMFASTRFHDANPKLSQALLDALQDSMDLIHRDPRQAAEIYLEVSGDKKSTLDEVLAQIEDPETFYERKPRSVMQFADFMHQTGLLKNKPGTWSDIFFPGILR